MPSHKRTSQPSGNASRKKLKETKSTSTEDAATSMNDLGISILSAGDTGKAKEIFIRALHHLGAPLRRNRRSSCMPSQAMDTSLKVMSSNRICYHREEYDEGMHIHNKPIPFYENDEDASKNSLKKAILLYNVGQTHVRTRDYAEAKSCFTLALAVFTEYDRDVTLCSDIDTLKIYQSIAYCCYCLGENSEAMEKYQKALENVGKVALNNVDLAALCNCISILHLHEANETSSKRALELLQCSVAIYEATLGKDSNELATCLGNLGRVYYFRADYIAALICFQDALRICVADLREWSPLDSACLIFNIGQTCLKLRNLDEALKHFKGFLGIARPRLGSSHADILAALRSLARVYREKGYHHALMTIVNETLELCQGAKREMLLSLSITLRELGCLCYELKAYRKALQCYLECLKLQKALFQNTNHEEIMLTLLQIAQTYKEQKQYESSLKFYIELYTIQLNVFGPSSLEVASCLSSMGLVQYLRGNHRSSLRFYKEALSLRENFPQTRATQFDISATLNSIGLISFRLKKYEEAKLAFIRCIQMRRKVEGLGATIEDSILYSNLATTHMYTGEYKESFKLYRYAIDLERKVHGARSMGVAISLQHLAHLHSLHGELDEAYECLAEALDITVDPVNCVVSEQPQTVAKLLNLIGNIHLMRADMDKMMDCFVQACRAAPGFDSSIAVAGHSFSWISRTNPPCAPVA